MDLDDEYDISDFFSDDDQQEIEDVERPLAFDVVVVVLLVLCLIPPLVRMQGFLRIILAFKATFLMLGIVIAFINRAGLLEFNLENGLEPQKVKFNQSFIDSFYPPCFEQAQAIYEYESIFHVQNQTTFGDEDGYYDLDSWEQEDAYEWELDDVTMKMWEYVEECSFQRSRQHGGVNVMTEALREPSFGSGWAISHWIPAYVYHMEEGMTMILLYELFACTCRMQVRVFKWIPLMKKVGGVALAGILAEVCNVALLKALEAVGGKSSPVAVDISTPFGIFLVTLHTCCDAYLLFRIFMALKANGRFREQHGSSNSSNAIMGLALVFFLGQMLRFALVVANCTYDTVHHMNVWRCMAERAIRECFKTEESVAMKYVLPIYGAVFEYSYLTYQVIIAYVRRRGEANGRGHQ